MRRSLIVLLGLLAVGVIIFAGSFHLARRACVASMANSTDDLEWLRREFHLGDTEVARIRHLHEGYLPKCGEMCERIAAKKHELETALAGATNVTPAAEQALAELGSLRAQCQGQMLKHFIEVSRAMPPEQGRRYLAEMQRLTLGFHEQVEQSMSGSAGHAHGRH